MLQIASLEIAAVVSPSEHLEKGTTSTGLLMITLGCAALAYVTSIILPAIITQAQLSLAENGDPINYREHPWVIGLAVAIGGLFLGAAFLLAQVFPPADRPTAMFLGASAGPVFSGIVNVPRFALHRGLGSDEE